ncbi:MAG: hypothetical protein JWM80_3679 [Cyanobacteria bacterium RYN_339]|nr:hypothetical protein [Cyanobacteria bacterium RYN_339]
MQTLLRNGLIVAACLGLVGGCGTHTARLTSSGVAVEPVSPDTAGAVQVTMSGQVADRAVRSLVSDVAFYRITLTGNGLAAPLVKQCAAPTGSNGKVSVRFDDLTPGTYTMTVEALDANMAVLGSDSQPGTVTPGLCTYIDLHVKLPPTGVGSDNGSLGARITVEDGGTVTGPVGDCPANEGFVPIDGSTCPVPAPTATP